MTIQRWLISCFCLLAAVSWRAAEAQDLRLVIQPIQVCQDDGTGCANAAQTLFANEGDKIWAQAGIDLEFLPWLQINDTDLLSLNFGAEFGAAPGTTIRMLFVNDINDCGGVGGAFGCGRVDANGVAIANSVFTFDSGNGRLDTIAHELGHNLGLGHDDFGAGGQLNLMTTGGTRTIPTNINQIFPDGLMTDQLTQLQINEARASAFLVAIPLPGTVYLLLCAVLCLFATRRRALAA